MTSVTIRLADSIMVRTVEGTGEVIRLDTSKLSAELVAKVFEGGAKVILTNAYNGGGKDKSEAEKIAQLKKRLDSWYAGEYAVVERGESQYTAMREHYYVERLEQAGKTRAEVDKAIKALVASTFGEKEPATFSRFLDAVAAQKYKALSKDEQKATDAAAIRAAIETGLAERTAEAARKRAEIAAGIDTSDLGLDF
jgi:hypothetical protein